MKKPKLVQALLGKESAEPASDCCCEAKENIPAKVHVSVKLNNKLWHEDIKRYIFTTSSSADIHISETETYEFDTEYWRCESLLRNDNFDSITIGRERM